MIYDDLGRSQASGSTSSCKCSKILVVHATSVSNSKHCHSKCNPARSKPHRSSGPLPTIQPQAKTTITSAKNSIIQYTLYIQLYIIWMNGNDLWHFWIQIQTHKYFHRRNNSFHFESDWIGLQPVNVNECKRGMRTRSSVVIFPCNVEGFHMDRGPSLVRPRVLALQCSPAKRAWSQLLKLDGQGLGPAKSK